MRTTTTTVTLNNGVEMSILGSLSLDHLDPQVASQLGAVRIH